jgi:intein/homing endonuclease
VIDKREATLAVLTGKKYEIVGHFTSAVAGKTRAGGQCLSSDTLVVQSDGNIVEIQDLHNPSPVASADFEQWKTIESTVLDKWETEKQPLTIITKYPRFEIQSSADHSFFVFEKGRIVEKKAGELQTKGLLLFPEKIHIGGKLQALETEFFNSYSIDVGGRKQLLEIRTSKGLFQKELANKLEVTQTAVSVIERGTRNIRHHLLVQYCKALEIDPPRFIKKHCKPVQEHTLPEILNQRLAQVIGYWLGDGNTEKERICFSEQDEIVAREYATLFKELFNTHVHLRKREEKGYYEIRVYGKPLVKFLQAGFPEKHTATTSEIPKKILKSPNSIVAGFLRGFFDAEGYASVRGIGIGINNKKLARQLQLILLRFGIISSLTEYDNRKNPYSKKTRYTLQISEKKSYELFLEHIGFTFKNKNQQIRNLIKASAGKSRTRQVAALGRQIRNVVESFGWKKQRFVSANMFLQDKRKIGKEAFEKTILEKTKANPLLYQQLQAILNRELLPVEIYSIKKSEKAIPMTDISVQHQNFIGGGLIVHNSSVRFEHLREEAAKDFFRRVSEKINQLLVDYEDKLKGVIVGGPGMTKQEFLKQGALDYRLKDKILGTVDNSYTDESGIRELMQKSEEILKDTAITRERQIVNRFLEQAVVDGLATYGQKQTEEALTMGKASDVLVSEAINWEVVKLYCENDNFSEEKIVKEPEKFDEAKERCSKCGGKVELLEEVDYLDWMVEKAHNTSAIVHVISQETPEGQTFYRGFGGIGAILRYK